MYTANAPVKLFCTHPPMGSPGVRENMHVIKKGGALEGDKNPGATTKKVMSPWVPGGWGVGMGAEQFDWRIISKTKNTIKEVLQKRHMMAIYDIQYI